MAQHSEMRQRVAAKMQQIVQGVLNLSGVYLSPKQGVQSAGNSRSGASVFTSQGLAQSSDIRAGGALAHALAAFVTPFHVLTKKEADGLEKIVRLTGNTRFYAALDKLHADSKGENFVATFLKSIGALTSHSLAVHIALALYDHWGVMSPAQKSLSVVATAIQVHKTDEGKAICDLKIVSGEGLVFTVKDALDMLQEGKNPYPLVQNWDQIYRLVRVYNDQPTVEGMMDFALSHNLLGKGANDAAIPGVSKGKIQSAGGKPAPQFGVGALAVPRGKQSQGYATAAQTPGGDVIVPQPNAPTSAGALAGSLVGTKAGRDGASQDAASVYGKWNKSDAKAKDKGSEGGSALVAGLGALKQSNPFLYSAMVAFLYRYEHRSIDIKTPVSYIGALAGIALARIVSGKSEEKADREGAALANSITQGTPADFAKLQVNIRALYANFRVSSRADAYQLSNQAYAEGRINDSDLVAMHEIYNIIYDNNSLGQVSKLLQGKDRGLEIAKKDFTFVNHMTQGQTKAEKQQIQEMTKEQVRARNQAKYAKQAQQQAPQQQQPDQQETQEPQAEEQTEQPAQEQAEPQQAGA